MKTWGDLREELEDWCEALLEDFDGDKEDATALVKLIQEAGDGALYALLGRKSDNILVVVHASLVMGADFFQVQFLERKKSTLPVELICCASQDSIYMFSLFWVNGEERKLRCIFRDEGTRYLYENRGIRETLQWDQNRYRAFIKEEFMPAISTLKQAEKDLGREQVEQIISAYQRLESTHALVPICSREYEEATAKAIRDSAEMVKYDLEAPARKLEPFFSGWMTAYMGGKEALKRVRRMLKNSGADEFASGSIEVLLMQLTRLSVEYFMQCKFPLKFSNCAVAVRFLLEDGSMETKPLLLFGTEDCLKAMYGDTWLHYYDKTDCKTPISPMYSSDMTLTDYLGQKVYYGDETFRRMQTAEEEIVPDFFLIYSLSGMRIPQYIENWNQANSISHFNHGQRLLSHGGQADDMVDEARLALYEKTVDPVTGAEIKRPVKIAKPEKSEPSAPAAPQESAADVRRRMAEYRIRSLRERAAQEN